MKAETAFHEQFHRDDEQVGGSDRGFGFVFGGACAIFGSINYWRGHDWWLWWLVASVVFLMFALALPRVLYPLNWLWIRFGLLLNRVMQPIIMALLFLTTIVPMGLLFRMMGKDFLRRRIDPSASSYWILREPPGPAPDSFKNQF